MRAGRIFFDSAFTIVNVRQVPGKLSFLDRIYELETNYVYTEKTIFDWMVNNPGKVLDGFFTNFVGDQLFLKGKSFKEIGIKIVSAEVRSRPDIVYLAGSQNIKQKLFIDSFSKAARISVTIDS